MDLSYSKKSRIKLAFIIVSMLIGASTLYYTNDLVKTLAEREDKLIDLYAKGLEFIITTEDNQSIGFLFNEIVEANKSVPVILADANNNPISYRNVDFPRGVEGNEEKEATFLREEIAEMKAQHKPIEVAYGDDFKNYIYYKNSYLLTQLMYYPYVQLGIIGSFIAIAYLAFSYSKRSEQNKVWVGLAKETAHQLGTPLSSLMAWVEYLKTNEKFKGEDVVTELEKDVNRLGTITERFSNIGSVPVLEEKNVFEIVNNFISYLSKRISQKIEISVVDELGDNKTTKLNTALFEWVVENISKNAIDAMDGKGQLTLTLSRLEGKVALDISDTGKGLTSAQRKRIFTPGFTTKKRGWGLGLTLAKRIIEDYHKGKLLLKSTAVGKGTTFRIVV